MSERIAHNFKENLNFSNSETFLNQVLTPKRRLLPNGEQASVCSGRFFTLSFLSVFDPAKNHTNFSTFLQQLSVLKKKKSKRFPVV